MTKQQDYTPMRPTPTHSPDGMAAGAPSDRFSGIKRDFTPADVAKLSGSFRIRHTLAEMGAARLWHLLKTEPYVNTLGALTGNQAMQQVKAGLKAIYLSGWQVAADANTSLDMYPDQSLYAVNSVPQVVTRINNALRRCDQIAQMEGDSGTYWMAPIIADAEAGFGGALNAFELMRAMIAAGAAGVHFEDQLASEKKCGHLGGKVLIPISQHIRTLNAARLAADVEGVATVLLCRTDAHSAQLLTADVDERDRPFLNGERTPEGFHRIKPGVGVDYAIARGLAFAPYADLLWWETSEPNLEEAQRFADAIHAEFPGKMLAYNCSPSFNWAKKLGADDIASFQQQIGAMGYKFQFVTLAGFHSLNHSMFKLAKGYKERGMAAYSELQQAEFASEPEGYTATRHQREVGTGWFDAVAVAASGGRSSTTAMAGSTETEQFHDEDQHTPGQEMRQMEQQQAESAFHQGYDDGLVHSHGWANAAPPARPATTERSGMVRQMEQQPSANAGVAHHADDHDHDHDDGLVHGHAWAAAPSGR